MYLTLYFFDGDPRSLIAAHQRMLAEHYPAQTLTLNALVRTQTGVAVVDACPSRDVFEAFAASGEFRDAPTAAGLPEPRIQPLGDVERLHVADAAVST